MQWEIENYGLASGLAVRATRSYNDMMTYAEEEAHNVMFSIDRLREVVTFLAGLPGRKSVLYISNGLPMVPGLDLFNAFADAYNDPTILAETQRFDRSSAFKSVVAAAKHVDAKEFEPALKLLEQILALQPGHAEAKRLFGLASQAEGTRRTEAVDSLLAEADGVHLGADDLPIRAARRLLGHEKLIGATANTPDLATEAEAQGADYVGCGAVFPSPTRPDREVVGAGRVAEVAAGVRLPVFAIGGITLENLGEVLAAGCRRVAVCGAIVGAEDPEGVTREFVARLGKV